VTTVQFAVRYIPPGSQAVVDETAEAASGEELRARLNDGGNVVLALRASGRSRNTPGRRHFDVAWWCRELRTLLAAGMTAVEAIETLATGGHDAVRDRVHAGLLRALREGQSLSRAMRAAGVFPDVLIAGVTASERTSTLAHAVQDYLRYDEVLERLRRRAVSAAIYPAVVVGVGALITMFLLVFVIPRFSRMYVDFHGAVSPATHVVLWLSRALGAHLPLMLGGLAASAGACLYAWRQGWARRMLVALVERVDPLRRQWDHFRLAKLYQSLALMFRGGYTLDEALQVCQNLGLGSRMAQGLASARREIARGKPASSALGQARLTEAVTERLLSVGERTGGFEAVLQTIADRHARAFETFVERATRVIEPLLLLIVAVVVGGIVVMMYMPVFDIAGGLGGGS
jgi:general secretion pathway protein F